MTVVVELASFSRPGPIGAVREGMGVEGASPEPEF